MAGLPDRLLQPPEWQHHGPVFDLVGNRQSDDGASLGEALGRVTWAQGIWVVESAEGFGGLVVKVIEHRGLQLGPAH